MISQQECIANDFFDANVSEIIFSKKKLSGNYFPIKIH